MSRSTQIVTLELYRPWWRSRMQGCSPDFISERNGLKNHKGWACKFRPIFKILRGVCRFLGFQPISEWVAAAGSAPSYTLGEMYDCLPNTIQNHHAVVWGRHPWSSDQESIREPSKYIPVGRRSPAAGIPVLDPTFPFHVLSPLPNHIHPSYPLLLLFSLRRRRFPFSGFVCPVVTPRPRPPNRYTHARRQRSRSHVGAPPSCVSSSPVPIVLIGNVKRRRINFTCLCLLASAFHPKGEVSHPQISQIFVFATKEEY